MELMISLLLLAGLFFLLVGSIGLLRLKDVYSRMHATTKGSTLGIAGILLAFLLYLRHFEIASGLKEIILILFFFLTAPVGAHMIARAAYWTGVALWDGTVTDELKGDQEGRD